MACISPLVLVKPGDWVPPFAAFTRYLTYTGSVTEILKLGVEGFLGTLRPHRTTKRPERQKTEGFHGSSGPIADALRRNQESPTRPQEQHLHALVHRVLTSAGVTSVQDDAGSRDRGVDFVVWSDSLRGSFGNPVLIEVKGYLEGTQSQSAYLRLTKLVNESNSAAGILLYLKKPVRVLKDLRDGIRLSCGSISRSSQSSSYIETLPRFSSSAGISWCMGCSSDGALLQNSHSCVPRVG